MADLVDILMITYSRSGYTRLSLARLLDTCDETMRVWVWHNGNNEQTIHVVNSFKSHPRFYRYYHSQENKKLNEPTNWLWTNSEADFYAKVDDDCLVPHGWAQTLRKAHRDVPEFGVIGCWHFMEDDFVPELARKKIHTFPGGHQLMRNCWLGGSGYLMKRRCFDEMGPLISQQNFTGYCIQLASRGYIHGWYYPFIYQEHLDDPRCPDSMLKNDTAMKKWAPLSAINNGVTTVQAWQAQLKRSAIFLQRAPYDPKYYTGWRKFIKQIKGRFKRMMGIKRQW